MQVLSPQSPSKSNENTEDQKYVVNRNIICYDKNFIVMNFFNSTLSNDRDARRVYIA